MDCPTAIRICRRLEAHRELAGSKVSRRQTIAITRVMNSVHLLRFDVPHDCSVELSPKGYQFFTDIFQIFDKVCPSFLLSVWSNLRFHSRIRMEHFVLRNSIICSTPHLAIHGPPKTTRASTVLLLYSTGSQSGGVHLYPSLASLLYLQPYNP